MLSRILRELRSRIEFARDPVAYHRRRGARIGERVEIIDGSIHMFGSEPYLVTIGDDVTISTGALFIPHDGGLRVIRDRNPGAYYYAPIVVGRQAFIGAQSMILPGVTIGDRVVVGARSLVTRDVPDDTVVAGSPARPIRTIDEYAEARRTEWLDTSGLDEAAKERLLREHFGLC